MRWNRGKNRKITAVMLCVCLFLITGCGGADSKKGAESAENSSDTGGMGRYMEDIYEFPGEINRNGGLNMLSDGSMTIIDFNSGLYRSTDQGASWQREDAPWFPMMQGVYALAAVMAPDGTTAVTCSGEMPQAARDALSSPLPEDWEGNYCIFAFPDGEIKVVDFGFTQEDGNCISSLAFREDGRLFAGDMNGRICEVDMEHESVRELFLTDREAGYIGFCGDTLMAVGPDRLYLYDLEGMELLPQDAAADEFIKNMLPDGKVRFTGGGYPLAVFGGEEDVVYIACVDGLYRHVLWGSTIEQIIDGALSTFGDDGAIYHAQTLADQEFLVQFHPSGGLVRYYFDESIPSMPDQELRIYSLEETHSVRQAVCAFKKEHTDMYVRYDVGMKSGTGVTAEDAIKRLNTQILSGEGPDVIILDGLPADSYMEKGMLADLSGMIAESEEKDELFSNLLNGFGGEDGAVYAVPLCVKVPLLAGDAETVGSIEDLESFADEMEALRDRYPEGGLLGIYDPETMLKLFGMVSSPAWTDETGGIDREAVKDFYAQVKRIYGAELSGALPEEMEAARKENEELLEYGADPVENNVQICQNVLDVRCGHARLACGYVDGIQLCLDNVTTVIELENNYCYQMFPGQIQGAYIPEVIVGMSAESSRQEAAKEFIGSMLSAAVQENIWDGFPVNREAFAEQFDMLEPGEGNGSMTLIKKDGSEEEMELRWPQEEEEQAFTKLVEGLDVPVAEKEWLSELVYETGIKVLEEEFSVEEAVDEVVGKAAIYLAE